MRRFLTILLALPCAFLLWWASPVGAAEAPLSTRFAVAEALVLADPAARERAITFATDPLTPQLFVDVPEPAANAILLAAFERGWVVGALDRRFLPDAPHEVGTPLIGLTVNSLSSASSSSSSAVSVIVAPPVVVADASVQTTAGSWQNPQTYGLPPVVTTALGVVPPQQGADDVFGDPFLAVSDLADALLEVVDPHADLPSVRGTPLEAYVSQRPFAITLPDIELADLPIEHPADASSEASLVEVLDRGAGHLFSYPGEGGSVFLYSHSSNWPWVVSPYARAFREIHRLNVGDRVYVTYDNRLFVYQVSSKETVPAGDLAVAQSAGDAEQLVLYTCWPPDDITERYVVRAVPAGEYRID